MATWDPHLQKDIDTLEHIHRRAARWIKRDYRPTTSITEMLDNLSLDPLADHREAARLILMFKIMHNHVSIPPDDRDLQPANEPEAPTGRNCNTSEPLPRHIATPSQLALFPYGTHSPPMWRRLTLSRPSRVSWQRRLYHSHALLICVILLWRPADYTTRTRTRTEWNVQISLANVPCYLYLIKGYWFRCEYILSQGSAWTIMWVQCKIYGNIQLHTQYTPRTMPTGHAKLWFVMVC